MHICEWDKHCALCNEQCEAYIEVKPVKHGRWYRNKEKHGNTCFYCSACERMALADCMIWELTDYCPNCGATMDEVSE